MVFTPAIIVRMHHAETSKNRDQSGELVISTSNCCDRNTRHTANPIIDPGSFFNGNAFKNLCNAWFCIDWNCHLTLPHH